MSIQPFATASTANAISMSSTNGDADIRFGSRVQRVGGFHRGARGCLATCFDERRFGVSKTLVINFRNTFLFMWKNLADRRLLLAHALLLFPRLVYDLRRGRPELAMGFFQALPRMREALSKRPGALAGAVRTDAEIFHDPEFYAETLEEARRETAAR